MRRRRSSLPRRAFRLGNLSRHRGGSRGKRRARNRGFGR